MVQGIDFKKSAMLLMLTLTLVGCQPVGPDFQAPEATSVATHYRLAGQALEWADGCSDDRSGSEKLTE